MPTSDLASFSVPAAAIRGLVEAGALALTRTSPLHWVLADAGPGGGDIAPGLDEALALCAAPEILVRLHVAMPGSSVASWAFVGRGDRMVHVAVTGPSAADGADAGRVVLELGHVKSLSELAELLVELAACTDGPVVGLQTVMWPRIIQLFTTLFRSGLDPERRLPLAELQAFLRQHAGSDEEAGHVEQGLVSSGLFVLEDGAVGIASKLRPWLSRLWSEHALQVERFVLDEARPLDVQLEELSSERALFHGPPGQRVWAETLEGERLDLYMEGKEPLEPQLLYLKALTRDEAQSLFQRFLRVTSAAQPA